MTDKQYTAEKMREIVEAYDEYVALLSEEINGLVGLASVHGWQSLRVEAGKAARAKIMVALRRYPDIFVGPQIEHIIDQSGNVCHAIHHYPDKEDKPEEKIDTSQLYSDRDGESSYWHGKEDKRE